MKTAGKAAAVAVAAFLLFAAGVHIGVEAVYAATDLRARRAAQRKD